MLYITSYYLTHVKTASMHTSSHGSKHAYSSYHVHILNSFHKHSWIFTYKVEDSCCVDEKRFFEMSVHLCCPCYNTSNLLKDNIAWIFFFFWVYFLFNFWFLKDLKTLKNNWQEDFLTSVFCLLFSIESLEMCYC